MSFKSFAGVVLLGLLSIAYFSGEESKTQPVQKVEYIDFIDQPLYINVESGGSDASVITLD